MSSPASTPTSAVPDPPITTEDEHRTTRRRTGITGEEPVITDKVSICGRGGFCATDALSCRLSNANQRNAKNLPAVLRHSWGRNPSAILPRSHREPQNRNETCPSPSISTNWTTSLTSRRQLMRTPIRIILAKAVTEPHLHALCGHRVPRRLHPRLQAEGQCC